MRNAHAHGGLCLESKVTISEAVGLTGVSESTIRRDIKSGKVSSLKDAKGHRRIDIAELQRVYKVRLPADDQTTDIERQQRIALLQHHVADLQKQLQLSNERETALRSEKSKRLDLLTAEKEEKRSLLPPVEEKNGKSTHWLLRNPFGTR